MGNDFQKIPTDEIVRAVNGSAGNKTEIAKRIGVTWITLSKYIENIPEVREAYDAEIKSIKDKAVSNIVKTVNGEEGEYKDRLDTSKWFLLKHKKDDEFADKQEVGLDEETANIIFRWHKKDDAKEA
jgi:hypothetical protein